MNDYFVMNLSNNCDYNYYVIMNSSNSPLPLLTGIYDDLSQCGQIKKILIDQIMHVGNNEKRFISVEFSQADQGNVKIEKINFMNIPKHDIYRKLSSQYFRNKEILEFSLLTSIQKRMINKGIAI